MTMNCIFCKIVRKEIPAHIVYENEQYLAFLDIRPLSAGHTLVIPKEHHRFVWDVHPIGAYFEVVQLIARAQQKAFGVDAIHSKVVGEEVHHAHVWIYPDPDKNAVDKNDFIRITADIRNAID